MSFLDNLESNLKNMEAREERSSPADKQRRTEEKATAAALAPWGDKLRSSAYADQILGLAVRAGYKLRTKIFPAWLGTTLRLEIRQHKLELRPTPQGVVAVFLLNNYEEVHRRPVDLDSNPQELLDEWLATIPTSA